jgi:hypothetical protein
MENVTGSSTPDEAATALAAAEASRTSLADHVAVPRLFFASIGAAVAVQIGAVALGLAGVGDSPLLLVAAGLLVFAAVSAAQPVRFRRANGVWLGGLVSKVVYGTAAAASISEAVALGAATWAAFAEQWWLVAVASVAGGAAYALSGRAWLLKYRSDPAGHSRGESVAWLVVMAVLALVFLVLLVANR